MPIHSTNQRLALLEPVRAHIFWGFRSFETFQKVYGELAAGAPVVIADKGFTDRFRTVFSINREWGCLGHFVSNPNAAPLELVDYREEPAGGYVLELGQDPEDFSYRTDAAGYAAWLEQWPIRRFRPHPKVSRSASSLADDLAGARLVVGLNTSALIEASLAGVRVEAYGAHSVARGIDLGRVNCLRTLRSYEWDRKDPGAAIAIQAALDELRAPVDSPQVDAAPATSSRPRAARKASRKKSTSTRR